MKKNLFLPLVALSLLPLFNAYAQFDDFNDSSQTLEPSSSDESSEAKENSSENFKEESSLAKKNGTVPEYDLLKTKKKNPKVNTTPQRSTDIYIQEAEKFKINDNLKPLTLNDVIEQGLRKNYDFKIKEQAQEINEITFKGQKSAFWLPELKVELVTEPQRLATLHRSSRTPTPLHSNSPTGSLGLTLGDYTVFNWGKDYAVYLNQKNTYERSKQTLNESKRELKQDLVFEYFNLLSKKKIEKIRQDQLRQTSFIYRLNKEKITVGKTSSQDYYLSRSEYLKSQNDFHESKIQTDVADENLAFFIADPVGSKYISTEELNYKKINITLEELFDLAQRNNPQILNARLYKENATRDYDNAIKDNMPLPKLSINLGAYNQRFGPNDNSFRYNTYNNGGDVELVATINTTWALTGEDGLFNSNKLAKTRIQNEISTRQLEKSSHFAQSYVRETYKKTLSLQNQLLILEARLSSMQKTFDTVLENYLSGRSRYYDYSLSLLELTNTKIEFELTKLEHLRSKIQLAKYAGIEDFPGETFEQLAQKNKGK